MLHVAIKYDCVKTTFNVVDSQALVLTITETIPRFDGPGRLLLMWSEATQRKPIVQVVKEQRVRGSPVVEVSQRHHHKPTIAN